MKIDAVEASASDKPRGFQSFRGGRGGRVQGPLTCFRCQKQGHRAAVCRAPVLRRVLLQNRPSTWPPPMRAYSPEELDAAVQMQVNCRGNVGAAKAAVFRRDMFLATRDSDDDTYGEYLRALNAVPYRQEQREDDAFRNVKVAQAVIALPPSVDDERWAPNAVAFAVSILVFMLNLHWWSHVGSCFKASRASTPGQCPYRFPRTRAASTSCTSAGVELARRVPIEYVNGYNACMMLAFKSNHDVQVLIGGLKALLRIYNTTKYVTKRQNLVDSVTAVALGAFKRRELREQQNQSSQADRSVIGRRRVASMVFALTNRREIAGPLAAHYLLRGSCAYMSATCTTLPLYDVMRQLIQHDTHSCNLVEVREGGSNVTFRAASFFDDYLFRPVSLDHKCLYEFVMTCFRRKQSESTATSDLFLTGHPLYSTHSIRHHQIEAVPVITGVRMPYIDSETPPELVAKRALCALVLFKPFRSVLDLVSDPASETAWSDAYFQWESTRTSFVCEIMANMDDYYRASKRAQEDEESGSNELDDEADSDELLGTRNNVDGAIGNMPCNSEARIGSGRTDDFCHVFAADDDDTITGDGSTLPIFPTAKTGSLLSSFVHQELLGMTAEHGSRGY